MIISKPEPTETRLSQHQPIQAGSGISPLPRRRQFQGAEDGIAETGAWVRAAARYMVYTTPNYQ